MNDPTSPESSSGGTPAHDPVWEDIRVLLREANQPPDVRSERLQTLRWRALQRVQIDQVSDWGRVREWKSFWVDSIVGQ